MNRDCTFNSNYNYTGNCTKRDKMHTMHKHDSTGLFNKYTCLFVSSQQDRKKCIATVASIFNQQQQAISISTFTQNPHLEHKRPSLFNYADKEWKCSHIRNVLIFIANPTFRVLFAGAELLCLYLRIEFKSFIKLDHLFKSPINIITTIISIYI